MYFETLILSVFNFGIHRSFSDQNRDMEVREILLREINDGPIKMSDPYWSSNGHNVGKDVSAAARIAFDSIYGLLRRRRIIKISEVVIVLRESFSTYRGSSRDPDGFGAGTILGIVEKLLVLIVDSPNAIITKAAVRGLYSTNQPGSRT